MGELLAVLLLACTPVKSDGDTPAAVDSATTPTSGDSATTPTDSTPTDSTPTGDDSGTTETDTSPDADGDRWTVAEGDCDDTDPDRHPLEAEVDDGVDQDCDGEVDEGFRPVTTLRRWEVVVADGSYVSARTYTEFQNELGEVICTFAAPWGEGTPPDTLCPDCTWAFGFEGGTWTSSGPKCELIQTIWYDLDYLNYRTKTGAYDQTYGYSPTAWNEDDENTVYQQIWRYDRTRSEWQRTGAFNDGRRADGVYEYGAGTYVFGSGWYSYYY